MLIILSIYADVSSDMPHGKNKSLSASTMLVKPLVIFAITNTRKPWREDQNADDSGLEDTPSAYRNSSAPRMPCIRVDRNDQEIKDEGSTNGIAHSPADTSMHLRSTRESRPTNMQRSPGRPLASPTQRLSVANVQTLPRKRKRSHLDMATSNASPLPKSRRPTLKSQRLPASSERPSIGLTLATNSVGTASDEHNNSLQEDRGSRNSPITPSSSDSIPNLNPRSARRKPRKPRKSRLVPVNGDPYPVSVKPELENGETNVYETNKQQTPPKKISDAGTTTQEPLSPLKTTQRRTEPIGMDTQAPSAATAYLNSPETSGREQQDDENPPTTATDGPLPRQLPLQTTIDRQLPVSIATQTDEDPTQPYKVEISRLARKYERTSRRKARLKTGLKEAKRLYDLELAKINHQHEQRRERDNRRNKNLHRQLDAYKNAQNTVREWCNNWEDVFTAEMRMPSKDGLDLAQVLKIFEVREAAAGMGDLMGQFEADKRLTECLKGISQGRA